MNNLNSLIRKNIREMKPYTSARDEFKGEDVTLLDANESPYGKYNRYPDPQQMELKKQISKIKNIDIDKIFIGNGSDELLDLLIRSFCNPGKDKVGFFSPTYGMYQVLANLNDVEICDYPLDENFQISEISIDQLVKESNLKIVFICSPNNPTGNIIATESIQRICTEFKGIVVIDEAYIDFSSQESWCSKLGEYPNLVIAQTLSKAFGMAGLRIGLGMANEEIIELLNKVKPPYNVNAVSQCIARENCMNLNSQNLKIILEEREKMNQALLALKSVRKIYPSEANFILVEFDDAIKIYNSLKEAQIIVRNRCQEVKNCLRISIGNPEENKALINILKKLEA